MSVKFCITTLGLILNIATNALAQPTHFPLLGQTHACMPTGNGIGQINLGGHTCVSAWPSYQQRFSNGFWNKQCPVGTQLTGLSQIACSDVLRPDGRPQANFVANGCCMSADLNKVESTPPLPSKVKVPKRAHNAG